ncbi:response regulator PleD [mine drainage metagenome]|uniref:Response regulator PleD n=1 Tax=mine drainage metagenome TaxID=410659 RepID=A0A1J5QKY7_9ZZZZ
MQKSRILVVDDSRFFNGLVSKAVQERVNVDVVSAFTFAETRQAVETTVQPISLALVDLMLSDAAKGEAVDWLLERGVPCIVFTSIFSEDLRERLLSQNAIDYVVKDTPSSLDYLINLVERLHRNGETKVLLVEDSKVARDYAAGLLKSYQFQVIEAGDGAQGLAALEANPDIRLVITDHHMPRMDGVEMIKRMRVTHDQDRLSIIGLSAGGGGALSAMFIKFGANDFINKPFLPEEFFCRVMQNVRMLDMVDRLTDMATKDGLTGIHNRRFFFEAGEALFASARREHLSLTAAMIDVDFFKRVNDAYGHDAGDAVLRRVATALRRQCRQTDVVARVGGEEFAILAVNMDSGAVGPFFEKLRAAIAAEHVVIGNQSLAVTASFGVCHGAGTSLETMLKIADENLYRAKQTGRDRVEIS